MRRKIKLKKGVIVAMIGLVEIIIVLTYPMNIFFKIIGVLVGLFILVFGILAETDFFDRWLNYPEEEFD
jgi:hypothetical protein